MDLPRVPHHAVEPLSFCLLGAPEILFSLWDAFCALLQNSLHAAFLVALCPPVDVQGVQTVMDVPDVLPGLATAVWVAEVRAASSHIVHWRHVAQLGVSPLYFG